MRKSLLLLLLPAVLAVVASGASAQEVCTNQFSACVAACVKDKSPAFQDACIERCQTDNTACYAKHNGLLPPEANAQAQEEEVADTPPLPRQKPAQNRKGGPREQKSRPAAR